MPALAASMPERHSSSMRRRMLSTQQIETFRAVMLAGSVNAAAKQLDVSQPALTRLLRRTEDLVGFPLFALIRNRLIPTAEARLLFGHVDYISAQLGDLEGAIERIRIGGGRPFRLASSVNLARSLIPAALVAFRGQFPDVQIHLDTLQLPSVVDYLALGTGECFLSIVPVKHAAIQSRSLLAAPLVCVMPDGHPLADKSIIIPSDLDAYPLIAVDPARWYGATVRDVLVEGRAQFRPTLLVRGAESIHDLTASGLGIGVIDGLSAFSIKQLRLIARPLALKGPFQLHIQTSRDAPPSRYLQNLEHVLHALLKFGGRQVTDPAA